MTDLRMVVPAAVAWLATIILLSFPAWMLPASVFGWVCAIGLIGLSRFPAMRGMVIVAVSCAAVALVATAALAASDARRPEVLARSHSISSAIIVTTQTAVHRADSSRRRSWLPTVVPSLFRCSCSAHH